jgi:hypothetical protein
MLTRILVYGTVWGMALKKKGAKPVEKEKQADRALVIVSPALRKQLRQFAADNETTVRAAVEEAVTEFLEKRGRKV